MDLGLSTLLTPVVGGLVGKLLGGDEETTQTQQTSNIPDYAQGGFQTIFNDYIDRLYPTSATGTWSQDEAQKYLEANPDVANNEYWSLRPYEHYIQHGKSEGRTWPKTQAGSGKSYEDMLAEDLAAKKAATETFNQGFSDLNAGTLAESRTALQPYTDLLNQYVQQGNAGTGLFKPTTFSFGGKQFASVVPKANRNLATQLAGFANDASQSNLNLANLANQYGGMDLMNQLNLGTTYTPNAAETSYIKETLMPILNMIQGLGSTSTATGTISDSWSDILAGMIAGSKVYGNIMKNQAGPTGANKTDDQEQPH